MPPDMPYYEYVGGRISPEMETPKILWLKENRPHIYNRRATFRPCRLPDLARHHGDLARSVCTVTCKWTYGP